ncbi:ATP-binding protein [Bdellovibrio bacteriovorus]|uniref:ATP-binding protein n=1 Tax=Bdellovibrio bacteriovorus TaxID=959 RepID=UPI0021D03A5F|nr:ATP-binding protein [Bdellovibrio bacteriovorus]UXR63871.1 ATP-binding protein [Bdellovibrio bacteriovorus]
MLFTKLKRNLHYVLALSVLTVACVVLLGWVIQSASAVQVREDFAPMVVNTAISFFLISLSFLIQQGKFHRLAKYLSVFVGLLSALTLLEYLTGFDFGIDQLFVPAFYSMGVSAPGRMAISTAVCFLLLSLSDLSIGSTYAKRMAKVTMSSLVFGFGLLGFLGYFLNFSSEYGWGNFSRMAIHSALCFIFLATAQIWKVRINVRGEEDGRTATVPIYVVQIGVLLSVIIWQLLLFKDIERNRSVTAVRAEGFKIKLDGSFIPLEKALGHMARRMAAGAYDNENMWRLDAKFYYEEFKGIRRLMWADPKLTMRWLYPLDDFSKTILNNTMGRSEEISQALEEVRVSGQPRVSRVFEMKSGGRGFGILVPVMSNQKFLGVVTAAMDLKTFIDRFARTEGYHVSILQDGKEVYRSYEWDPVFSRDWASQVRYSNLGVNWVISFTPTSGVIRQNTSALPQMVLVFGVSITVLLGLALSFYNRATELGKRARAVADWKSAAMDATPLMMVSLDENGIIREMNSSAESLTGWKSEELAGKAVLALFHDHQDMTLFRMKMEKEMGRPLPGLVDLIEAMFTLGYNTASDWVFVGRDGRRFEGTLSVGKVVDEKGHTTGYLAVVEDVTQKRLKERQLKEQETKIITSSRLASLGEMAAGIAHEINNPLTIINGHLSVLRRLLSTRGLASDMEVQKRLEVAESTTNRIAKIVKGLRSYARESDQGGKEQVVVEAIVEDTLAFCADKFKSEGIELVTRLEPHLEVFVRPYQISQVLLNLLNNAADAVAGCSERRVVIEAAARKNGVEISVTDSGAGVPPFLKEKIMEPFFTTKEVGKGVGLGLSISQGIIQAHDGKFYLDDSSPKTRFVIWLPKDSRPSRL